MSEDHSEYHELFCLKTLQRGTPTAFALSPTERWLCSASDYGDLLIQRATQGYIYCHVGMDRSNHVVAIVWATDLQLILGCFNGTVYVATLMVQSNQKKIKITHLLSDIISPIRALAYDPERKILALGYRGHVSIWQHRAPLWEMIDIFRTTINLAVAKVNSLHFFGPRKSLFIGLDSGAMIWFARGERTVVDMGDRLCRIGATALSPDELIMAASTLDQHILIWLLTAEGPITDLSHEYSLESGREWHMFEPRTPVVITNDSKVVCGTLDGTVTVLSHRGLCLQKLKYGTIG
ncbi:hypothetical protein FRC12_016841 [Ceratobasidium sp. 428]|nr:hypothetical protein FRC12_016841 [Ceratobasidium sp. 428]